MTTLMINLDDFMSDGIDEIKKHNPSIVNSGLDEYIAVLKDKLTEMGKKGYRFNGLIYSPASEEGGFLCFEKSEKSYEYYIFEFDDIIKIRDQAEALKFIDEKIRNIGVIHATIVITPYNKRDKVVYAVAKEIDDLSEKISQFEKENPGKNALWQGKETKSFTEWLADDKK